MDQLEPAVVKGKIVVEAAHHQAGYQRLATVEVRECNVSVARSSLVSVICKNISICYSSKIKFPGFPFWCHTSINCRRYGAVRPIPGLTVLYHAVLYWRVWLRECNQLDTQLHPRVTSYAARLIGYIVLTRTEAANSRNRIKIPIWMGPTGRTHQPIGQNIQYQRSCFNRSVPINSLRPSDAYMCQ